MEPKPDISLISCFRTQENWSGLKKSFTDTHGHHVEFFGINNCESKYSLPEAYNEGIQNAQGEILIFVHDDVRFLNTDWLNEASALLKSESTGVLGCAGGTLLCDAPAPWWANIESNTKGANLLQGPEHKKELQHGFKKLQQVATLDGFILITTKENCKNFRFSNQIGKWHAYDLDICLHMVLIENKVNYVLPEVFAYHDSPGNRSEEWGMALINVWEKYRQHLKSRSTSKSSALALTSFLEYDEMRKWSGIKTRLLNGRPRRGLLYKLFVLLHFSEGKLGRTLLEKYRPIYHRFVEYKSHR